MKLATLSSFTFTIHAISSIIGIMIVFHARPSIGVVTGFTSHHARGQSHRCFRDRHLSVLQGTYVRRAATQGESTPGGTNNGSGAQASRGRGAVNRRRPVNSDEEEFADMSSKQSYSKRAPPPNQSQPWRNTSGTRPRQPPLSINPNWQSKAVRSRAVPAASQTFRRTLRSSSKSKEDDQKAFTLPSDVKARGLNEADFERARYRLEAEQEVAVVHPMKGRYSGDEGDSEGEEEDEVDDDVEEKEEEQEEEMRAAYAMEEQLRVHQAGGGDAAMQERIRLAQSNPYAVSTFGGLRSSSKAAMEDWEMDTESEHEDRPRPLRYRHKIVMDVGTCPGCGNAFQTKDDCAPGFLPEHVQERLQQKAVKMEEQRAKKQTGPGAVPRMLSPEEEVEMLLRGEDPIRERSVQARPEDVERENGREEETGAIICQRCHKLKHQGEVETTLRPGWSENALLTPERFREILSIVRKKRCAIVCLIDIFDFHGSLLYNLPKIIGANPVLIAVNKADLLPSDLSQIRVKSWVKQELEKLRLDIGTNDIHLVSCKNGQGVRELMQQMKLLARTRKRDLYVIGAANVGKSTFINQLIELGKSGGPRERSERRQKKSKGAGRLVTTSSLPGTTLNLIEVDLGDRVSLYDTPGLILPHQITTVLNTTELKAVIPQKRINHVTLRLAEGKSVLLGGLARLDMLAGRPFLFTFFVSNEVKLHQTTTNRADDFVDKHIGELLYPPWTVERREELGRREGREFEIGGTGWKSSAVDIVISGLGWISVMGALSCKVRIVVPESVGVRLRAPLLPYETWETTAKWTGSRAVKGNEKKGSSR